MTLKEMAKKIDDSPIPIGVLGDYMGLCKNFEECENHVIRPRKWTIGSKQEPICKDCQKVKNKEYNKIHKEFSKKRRRPDMIPIPDKSPLGILNKKRINNEITHEQYKEEIKKL